MDTKNAYDVLGIMSGTSLDGLDLAHCTFSSKGEGWKFKINQAKTILYNKEMKASLSGATSLSSEDLKKLDEEFGDHIGNESKKFLNQFKLKTDFIASHGHTVFHQPEKGITLQIGDGERIMQKSGLSVINDFRSLDVKLGGQGAPLVPIGDHLLFSEYSYCVNLGGFMNISTEFEGRRVARDICPFNIVLNSLSKRMEAEYDEDGMLSANGKEITELSTKLNQLDYYKSTGPASLGVEWVNENISPLLSKEYDASDLLKTIIIHSVNQLDRYIQASGNEGKVLLSGGGVYNKTFLDLASKIIENELQIPTAEIIEFKEALIFAFLGLLRIREENNTLSSVTGASRDSCGGQLYMINLNTT